MFSSTVRKTAEAVVENVPIDPAELVALAELASEGFGPWDSPYTKGPRDVIEALARQHDGVVVLDDIGRRCVTREAARALFAERAEAERRQWEAQQRHEEELAEQAADNRPRGGVPVPEGFEGVSAAAWMLQAAQDAAPRRTSPLEEALANDGALTYHPVGREDEL